MVNTAVFSGNGYQSTYFKPFIPGEGHDHDSTDTDPIIPLTSQVVHHEPTSGQDGVKDVSVKVKATVEDDLNAMVVLKGRLSAGEWFIRCINQKYQVPPIDHWDDAFWVDASGNIMCNYIDSATTDDIDDDFAVLSLDIEENTERLDAATPDNVADTLVLRDENGDIQAHGLTCNHLFTTGPANAIDIYEDGALRFIPYLPNGQIDQTAYYRFGRNTEEIGDQSGAGDGLEFKHHGQEILIQVQEDNSTIFMKGDKSSNQAMFIEVRNAAEDLIFSVNKHGDVFTRKIVAEKLESASGEFPACTPSAVI